MDDARIERTLGACEDALAQGGRVDLTTLGFWKAVSAVKRTPGAAQRYADRIARIDRAAFVRATPIVLPAWTGLALEGAGTIAAVVLVVTAPSLGAVLGPGLPWMELALIAGAGALVGTTHGLAHYVTGRLMGIRFTHFFSRPPQSPQPGFKTDYATYLRAPARSRAWMHASGAIVSKVVPFAIAAVAAAAGAQAWAVWALLALGVVQLVTDALFSTRASDWKKFKRELRFAR